MNNVKRGMRRFEEAVSITRRRTFYEAVSIHLSSSMEFVKGIVAGGSQRNYLKGIPEPPSVESTGLAFHSMGDQLCSFILEDFQLVWGHPPA